MIMARLLNMRPDNDVEPHLTAYLADLRQDNLLPRTIREKRLTILRVARFLGHPLAEATPAELKAWQAAPPLRGTTKKPASMHNDIVHLTVYFRWLVATDRREDNPTVKGLRRPRKIHRGRGPTPIPEVDLRRALDSADREMRLWLQLGANCGLRCMEIATLQAEDVVDGIKPKLRVLGKGEKERVVTLPTALRDELLADDMPSAGYLFARMDGSGGPPSAMRVSERVNDYLHALGITVTAHSLRHRFGTKLYEATGDLFLVAEQMGHSSVDTTRMYVQMAADKGRDAIEAIYVA
jgi:integrase